MTIAGITLARPRPGAGRPGRRTSPGRAASRISFFVLLAVFVAVSLFPFYWIVITSLKTQSQLNQGTTSLLPGHVTFGNYVTDFTKEDFLRPLLNSVIIALSTTAITVIIATLAGYALARTQIRGKALMLGFVLVAGFFPVLAMVGPMFIAYRHAGLLNSYPGLVIAYLIYTLPLATWFLANFFSQIPPQLEEAAMMDGASRLRTLLKVIVPVTVPAIFTVAILSFILAWNDFAFAVSFVSDPSKYTAPLAIVNLGHSQYQTFYSLIDAAVVIVSIPIALIVMLAQRRIVSGLTAGALK